MRYHIALRSFIAALVRVAKDAAESEVGEDDLVAPIDENVVGLDVTVDDALLVTLLECKQLSEDKRVSCTALTRASRRDTHELGRIDASLVDGDASFV